MEIAECKKLLKSLDYPTQPFSPMRVRNVLGLSQNDSKSFIDKNIENKTLERNAEFPWRVSFTSLLDCFFVFTSI